LKTDYVKLRSLFRNFQPVASGYGQLSAKEELQQVINYLFAHYESDWKFLGKDLHTTLTEWSISNQIKDPVNSLIDLIEEYNIPLRLKAIKIINKPEERKEGDITIKEISPELFTVPLPTKSLPKVTVTAEAFNEPSYEVYQPVDMTTVNSGGKQTIYEYMGSVFECEVALSKQEWLMRTKEMERQIKQKYPMAYEDIKAKYEQKLLNTKRG